MKCLLLGGVMALASVVAIVFACFNNQRQDEFHIPQSALDASEAQRIEILMWQAIKRYHRRTGNWPKSMRDIYEESGEPLQYTLKREGRRVLKDLKESDVEITLLKSSKNMATYSIRVFGKFEGPPTDIGVEESLEEIQDTIDQIRSGYSGEHV